jgi:capsular polysaccharide biosynthesis protein
MTVNLLNHSTMHEPFIFIKDKTVINLDNLLGPTPVPKNNSYVLFSETPKVVLTPSNNFYHFFSEFMRDFLFLYKKDPNLLFIIDTTYIDLALNKINFFDFFLETLKFYNIKYLLHNFFNYNTIKIDNVYKRQKFSYELNHSKTMLEYFKPYIKDINVVPFKNIYISRKKAYQKIKKYNFDNIELNNMRNDDLRIDNESLLESFLIEKGFEIFYPEDFYNFADQLNLFYKAKTIACITGSGLANMMFMQPNNSVIEFITPLVHKFFDAELNIENYSQSHHLFYIERALIFNQNYIGINNKNQNVDILIKNIQNNKELNAIFNNIGTNEQN